LPAASVRRARRWPMLRVTRYVVDSYCHDLAGRGGSYMGTVLRTIAYGSITED